MASLVLQNLGIWVCRMAFSNCGVGKEDILFIIFSQSFQKVIKTGPYLWGLVHKL